MYLFVIFLKLCLALTYADVIGPMLPIATRCEHLYKIQEQIIEVTYEAGILYIRPCKGHESDEEIALFDENEVLQNYTKIEIYDTVWPPLAKHNQIKRIEMYDVTPVGVFGNCPHLEEIIIRKVMNITLMSTNWLANCTKLEYMFLYHYSVRESAPSLRRLRLDSVYDLVLIIQYPLFSSAQRKINKVSIENFSMDSKRDPESENTTWKEVSTALMMQLAQLPELSYIYIDDQQFDLCSHKRPPVVFGSLQVMTIRDSATTRLCFRSMWITPMLRRIGLMGTTGLRVQFHELFSVSRPILNIDFEFVSVAGFEFRREDYLALDDGSNVTLSELSLPLECGCQKNENFWLARAVQAGLVTAPELFCHNGGTPADVTCERMTCQRINCNSSCVCCRDESAVIADCRDANLPSMPPELLKLRNLTEFIAPNNRIRSLPLYLPDNLMLLDLSGNNIWQEGPGQADALFAQTKRRVRLAGNDILCTCDNVNLIATLQKNRQKIEDYEDIRCALSKKMLGDIVVSKLCAARQRDTVIIALISVALLIAMLAFLSTAFRYYRREIKIFLYARGWCLCWIREEELDADRPYDVFLSFCHEDSEVVFKNILPQLDRNYSVCVHTRNWYPGEMITSQIAVSVEQSRRTIVVLSKNFVNSMWGRLEFQTAHVSGVTEGRVRVILIILDDVLELENLDAELRAYVRLNTYVKWGDPWFWEKLRFALPHRVRVQNSTQLRDTHVSN